MNQHHPPSYMSVILRPFPCSHLSLHTLPLNRQRWQRQWKWSLRATHRCTKWTCSNDWMVVVVCVWFVPLVWCKCYTFHLICIQEEKEGDGGWYEPPTPSIIFERGPQTPSMFPPPSPYTSEHSLELAPPTFLHPESLEMLPPREEQAWVCFGYATVVHTYSVWNSVPWFTGHCTYTVVLMCNVLTAQ